MEKRIELFDDFSDKIKQFDEINIDAESSFHKYTLDDGTIYVVPYKKKIKFYGLIQDLTEEVKFIFPNSIQEIKKICSELVKKEITYLELKELYRYLKYTEQKKGNSVSHLDNLKKTLDHGEELIRILSSVLSNLAPIWAGYEVDGYPKYTGEEISHLFDDIPNTTSYSTKDKYETKQRNMIYRYATSEETFLPTEEEVYNASALSMISEPLIISKGSVPEEPSTGFHI